MAGSCKRLLSLGVRWTGGNLASVGAIAFVLSHFVMSAGATTEFSWPGLSHFYVPKFHFLGYSLPPLPSLSPLPSVRHLPTRKSAFAFPKFGFPSLPPLPSVLPPLPSRPEVSTRRSVLHLPEVTTPSFPPLPSLPRLASRRSLAELPKNIEVKLKDVVITIEGDVDVIVPIPPLSALSPLISEISSVSNVPNLPSKPNLPGSGHASKKPRETP